MTIKINIYNRLRKMELSEVSLNEEGEPLENNVATFYSNPYFPLHISGLDTNSFYECTGKRMIFNIDNEEEYEKFLFYLSLISGFETPEKLIECQNPAFFKEIINFSRNEGTIGPIIANKLFQDFRDNYNIACCFFEHCPDGSKYWLHYQNWCAGLYVAKDNGAIMLD